MNFEGSYFLQIDCVLGALIFILVYSSKASFKELKPTILKTLASVGGFSLAWEILSVNSNLWTYNTDQHIGINIVGVPIEKILLIFEAIVLCILLFNWISEHLKFVWNKWFTRFLLFIPLILIAPLSYIHWYDIHTFLATLLLSISLSYLVITTPSWTANFLVSYWITLIPYVFVQLLLSGYYSTESYFTYSSIETQGVYLFSFPIEALMYWFVFQFATVYIFQKFKIQSKNK